MGNIWQLQPHTPPCISDGATGLPGRVGTHGRDKSRAGRAAWHGIHQDVRLCSISPASVPSTPLVTLDDAIWPRFRARHPQHGQTDAVLPELLGHQEPGKAAPALAVFDS